MTDILSTATTQILDGKSVLITGGTGSFGRAFVERALASKARKVIVFSRDEQKHYELERKLSDRRLRYFVGDIRDQLLQEEPAPMMYLSFQQVSWSNMWLLARGAGDPMALAPVVRREIHAIDPLLPVANEQPLARLVSQIAAAPRFTALIFGLFASAALVLAVVGVYGLVAYGVTQRTREIGVRLALGATPSRIVGGVVRYGVGLAGFGIAVGLWVAFALSRFMQGILYEVTATDALTYLAVAALLAGCAAVASILPARSAARLDPVRARRDE